MTDFARKRGDTYADEIIVSRNGKPLDITGYTFLMTLDTNKSPADDSTNVYQVAGTILDAAAGRVEFAPTAEQANRVGSFFFDIQMIDGAGRVRTIDSGKYKYSQDITKS